MFRRIMLRARAAARRAWWQSVTPGRVRRIRIWFSPEPKLSRGKITLTFAAALFVIISFNHQVEAQAAAQHHELQCQRADGRNDNRTVLFAIIDHFAPGSSGDEVRQIIDDTLPAIVIANCPPVET